MGCIATRVDCDNLIYLTSDRKDSYSGLECYICFRLILAIYILFYSDSDHDEDHMAGLDHFTVEPENLNK